MSVRTYQIPGNRGRGGAKGNPRLECQIVVSGGLGGQLLGAIPSEYRKPQEFHAPMTETNGIRRNRGYGQIPQQGLDSCRSLHPRANDFPQRSGTPIKRPMRFVNGMSASLTILLATSALPQSLCRSTSGGQATI